MSDSLVTKVFRYLSQRFKTTKKKKRKKNRIYILKDTCMLLQGDAGHASRRLMNLYFQVSQDSLDIIYTVSKSKLLVLSRVPPVESSDR